MRASINSSLDEVKKKGKLSQKEAMEIMFKMMALQKVGALRFRCHLACGFVWEPVGREMRAIGHSLLSFDDCCVNVYVDVCACLLTLVITQTDGEQGSGRRGCCWEGKRGRVRAARLHGGRGDGKRVRHHKDASDSGQRGR